MAIICGPITTTISYVSQSICGHLVKINDIRSMYSTIDVQVDSQVIPGVGTVSVSLAPDFTTRANITLLSKNTATGTATISFSIETIEVPPPVTATHYLDVYVKPHSWYSVGGAADQITLKLADISGAIINGMAQAGLIGYEYVDTDIIVGAPQSDKLTIRVYLNQTISGMDGIARMAIGPWVIVAIALGVVIIGIGIIVGYLLLKAGDKVLGDSFTGKQVGENSNQILENEKTNCQKRFPNNPEGYANCVAAGIESVTTADADFFKDPSIKDAGDKAVAVIDEAIAAYRAGRISGTDLINATNGAVDDTKNEITDKTKDKNGGTGGLLIIGAALLGLYILTKGTGEVARPVLIERERLRAGGY